MMAEQKQNTNNRLDSSRTSEDANMLVSEIMDRAADNVNELLQSISRWRAEESSKSETALSVDCCIQQRVERHLKRFFDLRRIFAEHQGDEEEDQVTDNTVREIGAEPGSSLDIGTATKADLNSVPWELLDVENEEIPPEDKKSTSSLSPPHLHRERSSVAEKGHAEEDQMTDNTKGSVTADISTQPSCDRTSKRKGVKTTFKKMKSVWKGLFKRKPNKKEAEEQGLDETAESDSSDSKSGSPSPIASMCTTEDIEGPAKADLSSVPLELVNVEVNDDEVIKKYIVREIDAGPGSSLDIRTATKADLNSVPLELLDVENEEIPPEDKEDQTTSSLSPPHLHSERSSVAEKDLSSVPLELVDVEDIDVMEDNLDKRIDVTPGPFLNVRSDTKADHNSVSLELLDMENEEIPPEDKKDQKSTCSSSPPHLHRKRSSVAEKDLSSVPLELVDVEDIDVMEDNLDRKIDVTPGTFLNVRSDTKADHNSVSLELLDIENEEILPEDKKDQKSTSSSSPPPHLHRERSSVAEKDLSFVPLEMEDVEDIDVMEDKLVKNLDVTPGPFLDIRTATEADVKSVLSELLDVENGEILPEDQQDQNSTSSLSPPHLHRERFSVAEKDLSSVPLEFIDMDTNTKNTIYTLIMCFFDSLTKEQRTELCKCDYSMDMKNKIADMTAEVFMHITQAVSHNIEKCSIGDQLVDTSGGLTPELMETIEKIVNSVLSEIQQAHPVVIKKRWFSKLRKNKVNPISDISDNTSAASLKFVDQNATLKNPTVRTRITLLKRIHQFCCSLSCCSSCCSRTEDVNSLNPLPPSPASEVSARTVSDSPLKTPVKIGGNH